MVKKLIYWSIKTLQKSEASGPEFKVPTLQSYMSLEKSLEMLQKHSGLNACVCQKPAC